VVGFTEGTLLGQPANAGSFDAFVRKYDSNGTELWTRQFGTPGRDVGSGLMLDSSGVYVSGGTEGTLPGLASAGGFDAFVRKYETSGAELWTRQFGTATSDQAVGVAVDTSGVYVAGLTDGTLPGQTSAGGSDAFVRKYETNGAELWTRQFGTATSDQAVGVAVDTSGVYVAGFTDGTLLGQVSAGTLDAFLVSFSIMTPQQALQELIAEVVGLNLKEGISNSLDAKLEAAVQALDDINEQNNVAAINSLQAFINWVEAQRGIHISEQDADALIAEAQAIISMLGG